jgi:hypothetical protein
LMPIPAGYRMEAEYEERFRNCQSSYETFFINTAFLVH